jgi:deoxyribodipyrimidine photolyase-related protein
MFTKPYAAGGNYINRMSTYCKGCRFKPNQRTGPDACPYTTLYWDFLARTRERWGDNRRMRGPLRTLARWDDDEHRAIRAQAEVARAALGVRPRP